mgnify:CR=1 FL=1
MRASEVDQATLARLIALKYPNYPTDHIMTKTTYLDDPEGNGIELYCESPEDGTWTLTNGVYETRRADGSWSDGREPLEIPADRPRAARRATSLLAFATVRPRPTARIAMRSPVERLDER